MKKIYIILNKFACQNNLKYKMDYSILIISLCIGESTRMKEVKDFNKSFKYTFL